MYQDCSHYQRTLLFMFKAKGNHPHSSTSGVSAMDAKQTNYLVTKILKERIKRRNPRAYIVCYECRINGLQQVVKKTEVRDH